MRPALRWALIGAAGLAVGVSLLPEDPSPTVPPATPRRVLPDAQAGGRAAAAVSVAPARGGLQQGASTPQPVAPQASRSGAAQPGTREPWPALGAGVVSAWVPPPPPAPRAAAPAASVPALVPPPAFPYQWLGQLEEDGRVRIFLASARATHAASPGDVLDAQWRVDGIQNGRLQLTWLATQTAVSVASRP
jgi:hypothetical protein